MIQLQNKRAIGIIVTFIDSGERKRREDRVSRNDE